MNWHKISVLRQKIGKSEASRVEDSLMEEETRLARPPESLLHLALFIIDAKNRKLSTMCSREP